MNFEMSNLAVTDPLADHEVAVVVRVLPDNAQRPARTALISVGTAGQPPVFVRGVFEDVADLIRQAWLAYGVRADVQQNNAEDSVAADVETVAEAVVDGDDADDETPPATTATGTTSTPTPAAKPDSVLEGTHMTQDTIRTGPVRRVFIYVEHRFDDPGAEYTVEQIKSHLNQYFPKLAHATIEEKTLTDGTVEISLCKQVARKGSDCEPDNRLALLLAELEAVPPYDEPLAGLTAMLGTKPLSLATILDAHDTLQAHANHVYGLAGRTAQVVKRCLELPPSPTRGVPHGF